MSSLRPLNLSGLRVLIVDDHQPMRRVMRDILRELGIRDVEEAANGVDALNILQATSVDLIITDYMMEPMTGMDILRDVRLGKTRCDRFLPILVVSAYTEVRDILMARDAGATEYLAKPFSAKMVFYRIKSIVENPRAYVETNKFFGPDRRRRELEIEGENRVREYEYGSSKMRVDIKRNGIAGLN
jgi:two-component system, chemotaxis family, chemotaxis protein CheY